MTNGRGHHVSGKDSSLIWQLHDFAQRVLHRHRVRQGEVRSAHTAAEQQVPSHEEAMLLIVEANMPGAMSWRVDDSELDISNRQHIVFVDVGVDGWRLGQRYSKHLCLPICRFIPWEIELAQIQIETPKECTHVNMRTKQHRIRSRAKLATDPRPLTG